MAGTALAVARDDVIATAAIPRAVLDTLEAAEGCIALAAAVTAAIAPPLGFFARAARSFCLSRSCKKVTRLKHYIYLFGTNTSWLVLIPTHLGLY